MKVRNMTGSTGRKVANQFIISDDIHEFFQSYDTVIAKRDRIHGDIELDRDSWNYSVTTGKYRNQFLGENKAETLKKIESGEYILTDLN